MNCYEHTLITKEDSPDADLGIYTSEIRGSDESGEGTYKVPYKSILQAISIFFRI